MYPMYLAPNMLNAASHAEHISRPVTVRLIEPIVIPDGEHDSMKFSRVPQYA